MRSFLEVFEMVVNKKSTQFLPEIDKISSLSLDKGEELTGDWKTCSYSLFFQKKKNKIVFS